MPGSPSLFVGRLTALHPPQRMQVQTTSLLMEIFISPSTALEPVQSTTRPRGASLFEILRPGDLIGFPSEPFSHCIQSETLIDQHTREIILFAPRTKEAPLRKYPSKNLLEAYSDFIQTVKIYFKKLGFLESFTPSLVECPGTEPYLDLFSTNLRFGRQSKKIYLPTSPELHLKKMLALDYGPVFEIKSCYRNGEISNHHEPEFLMLEWYRPFQHLEAIAQDVQGLLEVVSKKSISLRKISVQELFWNELSFDLQPETSREELQSLAKSVNVVYHPTDSFDEIFHRLFLEKIEKAFEQEPNPVLVYHYPSCLAAYSRLTENGWADRFEVYWKGLELANAFHELNDPLEQRRRMEADLKKKQDLSCQRDHLPSHFAPPRSLLPEEFPLDEEFLQTLESGIPPAGGIALGLDRLFMLLHNLDQIQDLKVFPMKRFF